jgi:diguanylate cyclase (GGDEF)-like protein
VPDADRTDVLTLHTDVLPAPLEPGDLYLEPENLFRATILVVDDSPTQRAVIAYQLEQLGYLVTHAADGRECLAVLSEQRPDLILLDIVMDDLDGWDTLARIRETSRVPVIMLTTRTESDERVRGLRAGADDYLGKPFEHEELAARIEAVLRRSHEARRDSLTGLPNRRAFEEHLRSLFARPGSTGQTFGLVLFDLDGFKTINDRDGHPAGDRALQTVARMVARQIRAGEELFRLGGDEFAIVVVSDGDEAARKVGGRVRLALAQEPRLPTLSAGVASFPADAENQEDLVKRADLALYSAKQAGKNRLALAGEQL